MHARATSPVAPLAHDVPGAAMRLGVGTSTVRELIASGDLRTVRIGRRLLIPDVDCVAFVERLLAESEQVA